MTTSRKRTARLAAGAGISFIGLGIVAAAMGGTASASVPGETINNPLNISATVGSNITLTLPATTMAFGTLTPGVASTTSVTTTVTSNDASGYTAEAAGVNPAVTSDQLNAMTASCPDEINGSGTNGSLAGNAAGDSPATGATVEAWGDGAGSSATDGYDSATTIANTSGNSYVNAETGASMAIAAGSPYELYYALDPAGSSYANGMSIGPVERAVTLASNDAVGSSSFTSGLYGLTCSSSYTNNNGTTSDRFDDTISAVDIPWSALSVQGGNEDGNTGTASYTAFSAGTPSGTYQNYSPSGSAINSPYSLDTNLVPIDTSSTVSGTAGSTTATTDTWKDNYSLAAPGNQPAGSYTGELDYLIMGN